MDGIYALKIFAAIVGGLVGLSLILHAKEVTPYRIVTESLATAIFAGAVVDKYFMNESAMVCCVLGVFVGLGNGYVIDTLKAIAPRLVRFGFKAWFARAFGFTLPESVVNENTPQNQDDVLDESNDEKAVEWLQKPEPKPPNAINRFKK